MENAKFRSRFYPFFGNGGSEWHPPDDRYQNSTPANACAFPAIGGDGSFHEILSFRRG